jgi:thiamine biosynthesis protein ThiS
VSAVVTLNGKTHQLKPGDTVARMLERIGFSGAHALVERNGEPVGRADFEEVRLEDGDTLVIARPVAGG